MLGMTRLAGSPGRTGKKRALAAPPMCPALHANGDLQLTNVSHQLLAAGQLHPGILKGRHHRKRAQRVRGNHHSGLVRRDVRGHHCRRAGASMRISRAHIQARDGSRTTS